MKNGSRSSTKGTHSRRTQYPQTATEGVGYVVVAKTPGVVDGGAGESDEESFVALRVSYQLIEALVPIVAVLERRKRDLADQIERAASSVSLNLGEGQRSLKGNQQRHYALAHGSANEVKVALRVATAWGWMAKNEAALAVLDRLLALLWKLTHPSTR